MVVVVVVVVGDVGVGGMTVWVLLLVLSMVAMLVV